MFPETIKNTTASLSDFCQKNAVMNRNLAKEKVKENPLTFEQQKTIIKLIFENCYSVSVDGKRELLLSIGNGRVLHLDRDFKMFKTNLCLVYRKILDDGYETINLPKIFEVLKSSPRYSYRESFSIFFNESRLVVNREENELINEIKIDYNFDGIEIDKNIYDEVVEAINNHWRGLIPLILDHIIAGQYVTDKKSLWLLILANSNFGKSKLFKWMSKFGGSSFVDFKDLGSDGINDKDPKEFLGKMCLVIDEVLKFNRPMFKIEEYLMVRPMRNHAIKVPIGSRIMLSADGGVFNATFLDDQIKNRVAKIDLRNVKTEDLGKLEVAQKHGEYTIEKVMEHYLFIELTKRINEYETLSKVERANKAEKTIKTIFQKFSFQTLNFFDKVEESLYEILENPELLDDYHQDMLQKALLQVCNRSFDGWLIQRPTNVIPAILSNYDNTLKYEFQYKEISQIAEKINTFSIANPTINGKKYRGLYVARKKPQVKEVPIVYENIDKDEKEIF